MHRTRTNVPSLAPVLDHAGDRRRSRRRVARVLAAATTVAATGVIALAAAAPIKWPDAYGE